MRKFLKITSIILASIILLVIGAFIYINTESGQNFVRGRAEAYLRNKLKTEVYIGKLGYSLPKYIVLNNTIFLDQAKDTLLNVGTLKVDLDMLKLLKNKVEVQQIIVSNLRSHIYRNAPDTNYNFTYILDAFASKKPATTRKKDTSAPLTFKLDRVKLDTIHLKFNDETAGIAMVTDLEHLDLKMSATDIENMLFHVKDLQVAGLRTTYTQDTSYLPPAPKDTTRMKLVADNVDLQRVLVNYNDNLNKFLFDMNLGALKLQLKEYNRTNNHVDINKLAISNSDIALKIGKSSKPPAPVDTIVKIDSTEGWYVLATQIDLNGINYRMDNENEPRLKYGMDYQHLDVKDLEMSLRDLSYNSDTVTGNLQHFAVKEKSGLNVQELRTVFNYNSNGVILQDLYLQTPNTRLQDYVEVHYPSIKTLQTRMESMKVSVNLERSYVGLRDLSLFVPALQQRAMFRRFSGQRVNVEARLTGFIDNINIAKLNLSGLGSTVLSMSGNVKGLPDVNRLSYNVHIANFRSSRQDLSMVVPPASLSAIRVPDRFGVVGQVAGTAYSYNGAVVIVTTDGYASVKGQLSLPKGRGVERYNIVGNTRQLNLGRILKIDSIRGPITASFSVRGAGFDPKTMSATFKADIASATVMRYRYHDVLITGKIAHQKIDANINSEDKNAHLRAVVYADLSRQYPAIKLDAEIDSIDLQALRFVSTELRARGTIHADIPVLNPDYPDGKLVWYKPVIAANGGRYFLDSLYAESRPIAGNQNIVVNFDALYAHVTGHMPLTKVGPIITEHINRHYYALPVNDPSVGSRKTGDYRLAIKQRNKPKRTSKAGPPPANYDLQFTAVLVNKPVLQGLVPGLTSFDSIHADGMLTERDLVFNANVPRLVYNDITVRQGRAELRGSDSALTYLASADEISNEKIGVWYARARGNVDQNLITTDISLSDSSRRERFALKANMRAVGSTQVIRVDTGLKLNYDVWNVTQPNEIVLASNGLYVQNFEISNAGQSIRANSTQPQPNSPMRVDINNFELASITRILSKSDTLLATGQMNGNVMITRMTPSVEVHADVQVQNLAVYGDTLGNVQAIANNKTENAIDARVILTGNGNDVTLSGLYYLKPADGNALDMNLALNPLNVRSIEGVVGHQIRNTSGNLRGNLKVRGKLNDPILTGQLRTENLRTTIAYLGTEYKMPSETIDFHPYQMVFRDFNLVDSAGNRASVNGSVATVEWTDLDFNLRVKAENWQALNSTAKDNEMFYGDLFVTTNLTIKGTSRAPSVDGNIRVLKNTKFSVVNPQQNSIAQSSKGIVEFINIRDTGNYLAAAPDTAARRRFSAGTGINLNITVDKEAEFSMIIDQASGDFVSIHGEANLITAIRPGGAMDITGSFTVASGYYQFNYNFIKRKFVIQPGSTITFGGDPLTNTYLNVTAIYETRVAPYDLVSRQVPDPAELNFYRQGLPFQVFLKMQGNLQTPSFAFDIVLPENRVYALTADKIDLVQAKLSQVRSDTTELNKQVFALMILNRFVADDPFSSGATATLTSTAVQSLSTFIGEQLNQIAGRLIKGIDLSVDLATTEDYTTGDLRRRTDLNVAASKRLMNDRLKITVGNAFELEGPQTARNNQSSLVPSNLAADYQLTGDGRYTVRVYRRNYDAGIFQGFISETGVNFILNADYNRIKTVFMRRRPRQRAQPNNGNGSDTTRSLGVLN